MYLYFFILTTKTRHRKCLTSDWASAVTFFNKLICKISKSLQKWPEVDKNMNVETRCYRWKVYKSFLQAQLFINKMSKTTTLQIFSSQQPFTTHPANRNTISFQQKKTIFAKLKIPQDLATPIHHPLLCQSKINERHSFFVLTIKYKTLRLIE